MTQWRLEQGFNTPLGVTYSGTGVLFGGEGLLLPGFNTPLGVTYSGTRPSSPAKASSTVVSIRRSA